MAAHDSGPQVCLSDSGTPDDAERPVKLQHFIQHWKLLGKAGQLPSLSQLTFFFFLSSPFFSLDPATGQLLRQCACPRLPSASLVRIALDSRWRVGCR